MYDRRKAKAFRPTRDQFNLLRSNVSLMSDEDASQTGQKLQRMYRIGRKADMAGVL